MGESLAGVPIIGDLTGATQRQSGRHLMEHGDALYQENIDKIDEETKRQKEIERTMLGMWQGFKDKGYFDPELMIQMRDKDINRARHNANMDVAAEARIAGMPADATPTLNRWAGVDYASDRDMSNVRYQLPGQLMGQELGLYKQTLNPEILQLLGMRTGANSQFAGNLQGQGANMINSAGSITDLAKNYFMFSGMGGGGKSPVTGGGTNVTPGSLGNLRAPQSPSMGLNYGTGPLPDWRQSGFGLGQTPFIGARNPAVQTGNIAAQQSSARPSTKRRASKLMPAYGS